MAEHLIKLSKSLAVSSLDNTAKHVQYRLQTAGATTFYNREFVSSKVEATWFINSLVAIGDEGLKAVEVIGTDRCSRYDAKIEVLSALWCRTGLVTAVPRWLVENRDPISNNPAAWPSGLQCRLEILSHNF